MVIPRGAEDHWVDPLEKLSYVISLFFTFSCLGILFLIVDPGGTESHLFNPLPISKQNYVKVFENRFLKKFVVIIFRQTFR